MENSYHIIMVQKIKNFSLQRRDKWRQQYIKKKRHFVINHQNSFSVQNFFQNLYNYQQIDFIQILQQLKQIIVNKYVKDNQYLLKLCIIFLKSTSNKQIHSLVVNILSIILSSYQIKNSILQELSQLIFSKISLVPIIENILQKINLQQWLDKNQKKLLQSAGQNIMVAIPLILRQHSNKQLIKKSVYMIKKQIPNQFVYNVLSSIDTITEEQLDYLFPIIIQLPNCFKILKFLINVFRNQFFHFYQNEKIIQLIKKGGQLGLCLYIKFLQIKKGQNLIKWFYEQHAKKIGQLDLNITKKILYALDLIIVELTFNINELQQYLSITFFDNISNLLIDNQFYEEISILIDQLMYIQDQQFAHTIRMRIKSSNLYKQLEKCCLQIQGKFSFQSIINQVQKYMNAQQ